MSEPADYTQLTPEQRSPVGRLLRWCLTNRLIVILAMLVLLGWGLAVAPFDWQIGPLPRRPLPTDAIPDLGENQQIIFTEWPGRSPEDVEDQITYPLTVALQGIEKVKSIRSFSMFGFSSIYVIFEESMGFNESRTRILEKLASLRPGRDYPRGTSPRLGPDATALGQIYWYTLQGRDRHAQPAGGWDLEELRTIQDWLVRYALMSAGGVSEVASAGGFVREYQIDVDPDAMRAYGVTLPQIQQAVASANLDVGAKTLEMNNVEYFIRGVGFVENVEDLRQSVVTVRDNVPVLIEHIATVTLGPALRRGVLDVGGAEAVGGVVVARYGENPLGVIKNVKAKIDQIAPGLPEKAVIDTGAVTPDQVRAFAVSRGFDAYDDPGVLNQEAWLAWMRQADSADWPDWLKRSKVTIVPFYDRTGLIYETLGTLSAALSEEILVTFIVVIVMVLHLRSSLLIGGMLPMAVLICFIAMSLFGVDANIVALSGIAIAIGTIVDMGIVLCENVLRHLNKAPPDAPRLEVVHRAASEVGSAVLTAVATTIVSFLPVFTMVGAEGKLFRPLAFTKTFVLLASILLTLTALPVMARWVLGGRLKSATARGSLYGTILAGGGLLGLYGLHRGSPLIVLGGAVLGGIGLFHLFNTRLPERIRRAGPMGANIVIVIIVGVLLSTVWMPLGPQYGVSGNTLFVAVLIGGLLGLFKLFQWAYPFLLRSALAHKGFFTVLILVTLLLGGLAWLGWDRLMAPLPTTYEAAGGEAETVRQWDGWVGASQTWPGLGEEFMPDLDEGSFLYMPTTMVHASIGEAMDILATQDRAFLAIPEIETVVGKIGRAETPLDPAPISMIETVIQYKSEYRTGKDGQPQRFRTAGPSGPARQDATGRRFAVTADGELIPDDGGLMFRQWRPHIQSPDDIWDEIVSAGDIPGTTSAPKLMPIKARLVMLQSGMRAPMGVKVKGPDLETIEQVGLQIEQLLKDVEGVKPSAVIADRIIGKPYLQIVPDRLALSRYGVKMAEFQNIVETAVGGKTLGWTVEGRQRFPIRVRYQRELRDRIDTLGDILVPGKGGASVPLDQLATIHYVRGPQVIKSEDTFLVGYVLFDKQDDQAEVDVVERARAYLQEKRRSGELVIPPGVSYEFAGNYQNQIRSQKTLAVVLPVALAAIVLILYLQFHSLSNTLLVFSGIFVAWAGGFLLLWLYGKGWFLDFSVFGVSMRELFQVHTMNLSVAVWVGFLALFGIATDNGVIQCTYLNQTFSRRDIETIHDVREATVAAAMRRIRPCLMTSATTILALLPVLTSTGRGSDVMVPMAIPSFGGMCIVLLSVFVVPVYYCWLKERPVRRKS